MTDALGDAAAVTTYEAGDAGSVDVARDGGVLRVVALTTADGWTSHIDEPQGREVEVDFTMGAREIDFNAELEDGQVRVRVRDEVDDDRRGGDDRDERDDDGDDRGRGRGGDDDRDDDRGHDDRDDHRGRGRGGDDDHRGRGSDD